MAKKGTRKGKRNSQRFTRYASRVYSPFGHVLNAAGNTVREATHYLGNVANRSVKGVSKIGKIVTNHTNMAIRNLTRKGGNRRRVMGGGGSRKSSKSRKSRKGSRKSRK